MITKAAWWKNVLLILNVKRKNNLSEHYCKNYLTVWPENLIYWHVFMNMCYVSVWVPVCAFTWTTPVTQFDSSLWNCNNIVSIDLCCFFLAVQCFQFNGAIKFSLGGKKVGSGINTWLFNPGTLQGKSYKRLFYLATFILELYFHYLLLLFLLTGWLEKENGLG